MSRIGQKISMNKVALTVKCLYICMLFLGLYTSDVQNV